MTESCTPQFASAPSNWKSNDFKAVLDLLSKVLQRFVKEAPHQDAADRSENAQKARKSPTEEPNEVKSPVMDVGPATRNQKSERKEEKEERDKLMIHTPYRPKDGYFHDPEISSQKGSMLSLPSDHSDRSYALSVFSVVSSTKMDSHNETILPAETSKIIE